MINAFDRFRCTEENSRRETVTLGDEIKAVIHAVDEIDVGDTRFAIHQPIPVSWAAGGVAGRVLFPDIRFNFDNACRESPPRGSIDDVLAD